MDEGNETDGRSGSGRQIVAAVVLLAVLVMVGLWLTGAMRGAASIQDCVASGRTNCAPVN